MGRETEIWNSGPGHCTDFVAIRFCPQSPARNFRIPARIFFRLFFFVCILASTFNSKLHAFLGIFGRLHVIFGPCTYFARTFLCCTYFFRTKHVSENSARNQFRIGTYFSHTEIPGAKIARNLPAVRQCGENPLWSVVVWSMSSGAGWCQLGCGVGV